MAPKAKPAAAKAKPAAKSEAAKPKPKPKKEPKAEDAEPEIPKVDQPDRDAHDEEIKALNEQIEKLKNLAQEKSTAIGARDVDSETRNKRNQVYAELDAFRKEFGALLEKKKGLQEQIAKYKEQERADKESLRKTTNALSLRSEKEIDDRMAEIEYLMVTGSVSLKDEKNLMKEMAQLKKDRPQVQKVNEMRSKLKEGSSQDATGDVREQIKELDLAIDAVKKQRDAKNEEFKELQGQGQGTQEEKKKLIDERNKINEKIKDLTAQRQQKRDEHREKEQKYREYKEEVRARKQAKIDEERKKRDAEREQRQKEKERAKLDEEPYVSERTLLEQTILFCKNLLPKGEEKADEKDEKKEAKGFETEGLTLLTKKEDRDEFYFAPTKKKAPAKSKKAKEEGGSQTIKHNIQTFTLFDKLKIDAPMTTDELPATLEKLEKELEDIREKVKQWEVEKARREELGLSMDDLLKEKKDEAAKEDDGEAAAAEQEPSAAAAEGGEEEGAKDEADEKADKEEEEADADS